MKTYKIVQVRSAIKRPEKQKRTLSALGLRKLNKAVMVNASPQIDGMIAKVAHLITVEEVQQ